MDQGSEWLKEIAAKIKDAIENGVALAPERLTFRELLAKFGFRKRRDPINNRIRNELGKRGFVNEPDFAIGWINDSTIIISINSDNSETTKMHSALESTHRISSLDAANKELQCVKPDDPLCTATTIMHLHNYSQLPVMTNSRDVKGVISWKSIGSQLSLGCKCELVNQCMDPPEVLPSDTPLLEAITPIAEHGYVLVRGKDRCITGIITASDLSLQFMQLAGPFLFIGEIERHLRHLVHSKFTPEERHEASVSKEVWPIGGSNDLTLGGYCSLLEDKENWKKTESQN